MAIIKQIKDSDGKLHELDALYWNGHEFSDITDALHGVVDTFVINSTKVSISGYDDIFSNKLTTMTIAKTKLDNLVDKKSSDGYKVGDIVLLEATGAFDRWVSNVTSENISLTILETQVATHHHTISVTGNEKALTDVSITTTTALAKAGVEKTVVTGVSGDHKVLTSVAYSGTGSHSITLVSATSNEVGSVGHTHKVTLPTLVSEKADVYTTLNSATYTPHTHTTTDVAGKKNDGGSIEYVTSVNSTQSFVTGIDNNEDRTGTALSATGAVATTTSVSTGVFTTVSGAHTHTVSVNTNGNVVTSVSLAAKVVTSVSYNAPTEDTVAGWTCSVDSSGILSFNPEIKQRVTSVNLSVPRVDQSSLSDSVSLSGSAAEAGKHSHGFSHTHSIPEHSHTYSKATASGSVKGITSLSIGSFNIHSHENNVNVVSTTSNSTAIIYLKGDASSVGTTTVVKNLKTNVSFNAGNEYLKVSGGFTLPTLKASSVSLSTMLSTSSITPAETSTEQAIKSITFNSANFISSISDQKTSSNVGGDGLK